MKIGKTMWEIERVRCPSLLNGKCRAKAEVLSRCRHKDCPFVFWAGVKKEKS